MSFSLGYIFSDAGTSINDPRKNVWSEIAENVISTKKH